MSDPPRLVARRGLLALCARLDGQPGEAVYADGSVRIAAPGETLELEPPFGLGHAAAYDHVETGPLRAHLEQPRTVGLLAVRLGGYAAAVYHDEQLVEGRAGTRFVKNRNRKGGSSSGRFARRRGEQARDLHDRAAALAEDLLGPHAAELDDLVLAGDRFALTAVLERAPALQRLAEGAHHALFALPDPRASHLDALARELWSTRLRGLETP